ncbi:hypothetical protein BCV72DRAFT_303228 [Rhizopus microsporus var. microsporus]|uniref:ER membrane protein complex subunit 7 beta-sandwich domain-containing protein n=2 Tax=Rhizopus microsporus TaxID=58291 RepID=A0A2G4T5S6_RHIZD|nr:uncharacterized protein RHIMIDRAFT_233958 [Rhizopus microsporus ATCC 52813]ORE09014.1 hypothetical protein BCV72DRAFT_303228 [Rhizopus microsporus var. microsporus]PHZ16357.1 hypothetical protein RHIMIDRAFT_233958 [Rhizopus microsporus ATCC 52813]
MRLLYFLFTSLLATLTSAVRLEGKIIPNAVINDLSKVDYSTARVALNGAFKTTRIQSDGRFVLYDVQPGSYMLEVHSIKYIFPKLRVDINDEGHIWAAYTGLGRDWNSFGQRIGYPLEIQAKAEADYFMQKQGFNLKDLFANKMFLMMGMSGLMLLFMPKMMKQMQEMNQEMANEASQPQAQQKGEPSRLTESFIKAQQKGH